MSCQKKFYLEPRKPNGIYYYIVRDPVSRKTLVYKSTKTTNEKQAQAIAMDWWTNGIPGKIKIAGINRNLLFCDYLYQFWDFDNSPYDYFKELITMGKSPNPEHALEQQKCVDRYYRSYFESLLLCEINEEKLQNFIVYLKIEKKLAASTVNSARNVAFVALKYAKRKNIIKSFDFGAVLRAGGQAQERGILTKKEEEQLFALKWPDKMIKLICQIAYQTSARLGEVRCLRVCDIHKDKITFKYSWSAKKKRQKSIKNNQSKEIPISLSLYSQILSYIKEKGFIKLDALLFQGRKPDIPIDGVMIRKTLYSMLEKIGINEVKRRERCLVFHSSRHYMAKNLAENGTNKKIAMQILGVKTSKIYDHYASHVDKETFRLMSEAIGKVNQPDNNREPIPFREVG